MQGTQPIFLFLLIVFNALSNTLSAQATFTATIFPKVIGKNETAELRLMFENAAEGNITPPSLKKFIVVSGPVQKSFTEEDYFGHIRSYAGFVYILKPKKAGVFTIGISSAKVDGKIVTTKPITLKVLNEATAKNYYQNLPAAGNDISDEPQQPGDYNGFILKKGESVRDKIKENLFFKVFTDKTSCYVGEPVLVTYKIYTRLNSISRIIKRSAFSGFSVIDLVPEEWNNADKIEKLNGKNYYVYISKAQLYPLQAGNIQIEPMLVENRINLKREEYMRQLNEDGPPELLPGVNKAKAVIDTAVITESKPVTINVKPLPATGKPNSFNGAVGNFMLDALIEKDSLTTHDAGRLKILLSGEGNITLVSPPELSWPTGLEGYGPSVKDGLNRLSVPVSGSKIFDYSFTAAKEGDYTIAPIEFSFFDLSSGKYKTISTKAIALHISKGTGKRPVIAADNRSNRESFGEEIFTHRWMIIVPVALLIIIGLLLWLRIDKKKQKEKLIADALRHAEEEKVIEEIIPVNPLQQSEQALLQNDARQFYEMIDKELHVFLAQKLKLPAESISKKTIADGLDKAGVGTSDSIAIQKLLDDIGMQLYSPFTDENKMQDYYVGAVGVVNIFKLHQSGRDSHTGTTP